jgi:hypothetical protein
MLSRCHDAIGVLSLTSTDTLGIVGEYVTLGHDKGNVGCPCPHSLFTPERPFMPFFAQVTWLRLVKPFQAR